MTEYFNYYDWNRKIQKVSNPDKAIINTKNIKVIIHLYIQAINLNFLIQYPHQ